MEVVTNQHRLFGSKKSVYGITVPDNKESEVFLFFFFKSALEEEEAFFTGKRGVATCIRKEGEAKNN